MPFIKVKRQDREDSDRFFEMLMRYPGGKNPCGLQIRAGRNLEGISSMKVFKAPVINGWEMTGKGTSEKQWGESPQDPSTREPGNRKRVGVCVRRAGIRSCHSVDAAEGS